MQISFKLGLPDFQWLPKLTQTNTRPTDKIHSSFFFVISFLRCSLLFNNNFWLAVSLWRCIRSSSCKLKSESKQLVVVKTYDVSHCFIGNFAQFGQVWRAHSTPSVVFDRTRTANVRKSSSSRRHPLATTQTIIGSVTVETEAVINDTRFVSWVFYISLRRFTSFQQLKCYENELRYPLN